MCGFAGFINNDKISNPERIIKEMSETILSRGPDDYGSWNDTNKDIFLCFRRLSILDLSEHGHQPMLSKSNRYIILFNGEIYNHNNLRDEINNAVTGIKWRGNSDTETLLASIEIYGLTETLKKCIGMFAIALYDKQSQKLYLARDRFGEKPLYYGISSRTLLFGSDLAAFRKHPSFESKISPNALKLFMNYSYVPAPYSIYEGFYKVQPGEILTIETNSLRILKSYYWNLSDEYLASKEDTFESFDSGLETLEHVLIKAIKRQMISDVPLGAFLSGGIDSSLIVSLMQSQSINPVKTFTIGFEDRSYDESPYAAKVASYLQTDHTDVKLTHKDAIDVIPKLSSIYSEPFSDSSQIPTYLVSKIAKENVTVALSGDAGDEMFAGYNRYFWGENVWKYISWMPFPLRRLIGLSLNNIPSTLSKTTERFLKSTINEGGINFLGDKMKKLGARLNHVQDDLSLYNSLCTEWHDNSHLFKQHLFEELDSQIDLRFIESLNQVENMMLNDIDTYLKEDILTKVDRAAMANSLETRAPFLDHTVAKEAWRFPSNMLYKKTKGKLPLRALLSKYIPDNLYERPKSGFGIPIGDWIKSELSDWAEDLLSHDSISETDYLNPHTVKEIWNNHKNGSSQNTTKIWNILTFISWSQNIKR